MADFNTLYCSECGSSDVQVNLWIYPNDNNVDFRSIPQFYLTEEHCHCNCCHKDVNLKHLKELWESFSDVPINDEDEIEEPFLNFEEGTSRFEVWHWFDERCPNSLHDDLMFNDN